LYDITAGRLQKRPVPGVYGKLEVFKDIKNSTDVEYLESKLKDLEDEAATVVRDIHDGLQGGGVKLSRGRLSILRKFIFLTHYRWLAVRIQEVGVEKWLLYEWLQGLKYYLDTPHHDIIATGERLRERYGSQLCDMLRAKSYPDSEESGFKYAIQYEDLANYYALGVWVASEESEFVLGGRAFGHYEGLIGGISLAHRLYVLTPRIAIILRRTCLLNPSFNDKFVLHSTLADVPISQPFIRYAKNDLVSILEADPTQAKLVMNAYRTTPEAEQDSFEYHFTLLRPEQTYAVNEVMLMSANLRYRGSVIFRQPSAMGETLGQYQASPQTSFSGRQKSFRPLLEQLRDLEFEGNSQQSQVRSSPPEGDNESTTDCQLNLLFGSMIKNHISFPSSYTRAFLLFHMVTAASSSNPISQKMCKIQDTAIDKLHRLLDPPLPQVLKEDSSHTGLVESLANDESEIFFSLIVSLLDQASVSIRRSNDLCETVINEAAVIGVTYWLAEERPDVLKDILTNWVHIWA